MSNKDMSHLVVKTPAAESAPMVAWLEERLVKECLDGNEAAWCALIDRYKNLIFSVPIKYRFSREEAADVFQMVCLELLSELANIRDPKALPKWILMVTAHKCYHLKNHDKRHREKNAGFAETLEIALPPDAQDIVRHGENEQQIRESISSLPPRCQSLIRMLFFEEPPRPYVEVAQGLGLARGSVGLIRQRCLDRLRRKLDEMNMK
jgi:RNA polymerase sigma factor (sigma-70 family)